MVSSVAFPRKWVRRLWQTHCGQCKFGRSFCRLVEFWRRNAARLKVGERGARMGPNRLASSCAGHGWLAAILGNSAYVRLDLVFADGGSGSGEGAASRDGARRRGQADVD